VLASTKTPEQVGTPSARWLIGLMAEHRELALRLTEEAELLVIETDPLSGTSALLALTLADLEQPAITVDARVTADALDLAIAIATAAITRHAPEAASWWNGAAAFDREGLQLARRLSTHGIDLERLRSGEGAGEEQLRNALELFSELSEGTGLLAIDHLDDLLQRMSASSARTLLGVLRAEHQRPGSARQLLVGRSAGRLASALRDRQHPLYRAGSILRFRRPRPQQFVDDLAIGRPWTTVPVSLLGAAAELANGASAYVWRIVDATERIASERDDAALAAWQRLREGAEPSVAQQFRLLGSAHRAAPTVLAAIACDIGPYELPLNPKSVNDALSRMRARGQVFSPQRQRWAISDPQLAAWARDHAADAIRRRTRRVDR